jgi:DNA-binding LacI/PurR family transcriptional regulator
MGRHRVTLQTIADRLGVSRTTVSNAFSRPDQLSPALRDRVLDAARELGYAGPDPAARTLRAGTAGAIGMLLPEGLPYVFADPYAAAFLRGVAQATEPHGLSLLLIPMPPGQLQEHAVRRAVVDGFCVHSIPAHHPALDVALRRGLPMACADSPELPDHPFVGADDHAAARMLAEHVMATGRRRPAVITFRVRDDPVDGDVDDARIATAVHRSSRERLRGILAATADAGIRRADVRIREASFNVPEHARRAVTALLDDAQRPDAIIALSDELAAGVMAELRARGLAVPDDIAVTGWDGTDTARRLDLTTVRQPSEEKGRIAAQWLLDGVTGHHRLLLPTELIVRGSTA